MKAKNEIRQERIQVFDLVAQAGVNARTPDGGSYIYQGIASDFGDIDFSSLPSITVAVDETKVDILKGSPLIENLIEARSIAGFTIVDLASSLEFQKGQPVEMWDICEALIFGGLIDTPERAAMAPAGGLYHPIRCADYHYFADKRLIAESYLATATEDIVKDIRTKYLADEGITEGNIAADTVIVEAVFNYVRATDALDALAEKAGKIWFIDENKALYFQDRDIDAAPWTATAANMDNCLLSGGSPLYRNRQYIRGGKGTTALQTEKFVADGEQNAFTVSFPFAKVPTFVEVNAVDKTPVGIKGLDAPGDYASYWNKGDPTLYLTDVPTAGWIVEIRYYGMFDILVLTEDPASIAARLAIEGSGTGYVDDIADEPTLIDQDASINSGRAKLAKYTPDAKRLTFSTVETGLKPGQLLTVNYPLLGLNNAEMLIEAVTIQDYGALVTYNITAIQGPESGSWTNYFKSLAGMKQELIDRLNVGSEQILIILVTRTEILELTESQTETIFACTTCDSTPCGGATPVVC